MSYVKRKSTRYLVIHYSATPPEMDIGATEINQWHKTRGWLGIGYHYVIRRDGTVEEGRPEWAIGAHVRGHNSNSIGICLVGGVEKAGDTQGVSNFTEAQWDALVDLLIRRAEAWQDLEVLGHRDFPGVTKDCPGFDVNEWFFDNFPLGLSEYVGDEMEYLHDGEVDEWDAKEEVDYPVVYVSTALPTLYTIARVFDVSLYELVDLNSDVDPLNLQPVQPIRLPLDAV